MRVKQIGKQIMVCDDNNQSPHECVKQNNSEPHVWLLSSTFEELLSLQQNNAGKLCRTPF